MNLDQLRTFMTVARRGSFSEAARERGMTQPGVTRQVQRLEQELRVSLFDRRRSRLEPTRAGEQLLRFANEVLAGHDRLLADILHATGELRIAASTTPGEFLVPDMLNRFTAIHPNVSPRVFISDSALALAEVRERRWDSGFVGAKQPGRDLQYDAVFDDEVVLAVTTNHPFAQRGEVELRELEGQAFVEREEGSGTRRSVQALFAKRGLALPEHRSVMELSSTRGLLSALERGYGIGWVSSLALRNQNGSRLAAVRLRSLALRRPLYMVQERDYQPPPVAAAFAEWVRDHVIGKAG